MKQKNYWLASSVVCLSVLMLNSQGAWGLIGGSGHDFSADAWSNGEICLPCHTPHNANTTMTDAPLWNHEVNLAQVYTIYSSPTLNYTVNQPGTVSKACLSCHDGTIAVDSFTTGMGAGTTFIDALNPLADLGTDLSDDHPIGIDWSTGLHSSFVWGAICFNCHTGNIGVDPPVVSVYNDRMECPTCHDVHNKMGLPKLVRVTMAGSQLCLTCHDK